jgi:hypothetical protein
MAAANGVDPASGATIPFAIGNKTFADSLQSAVLAPLVAQGLDMAWTDWQQGFPCVKNIRGLVPTAMLNHYRFHNFTTVRPRGVPPTASVVFLSLVHLCAPSVLTAAFAAALSCRPSESAARNTRATQAVGTTDTRLTSEATLTRSGHHCSGWSISRRRLRTPRRAGELGFKLQTPYQVNLYCCVAVVTNILLFS